MDIIQIQTDKKRFLELLLLADEQESMIDRYLERGELFALYDNGLRCVAVVTREGEGVCELKNIVTVPSCRRQGYAHALIDALCTRYAADCRAMLVGTGDSPRTLPFYARCGFVYSHRIPNFFTQHYERPILEDGVRLRDMIYLRRTL